jgi:hypothetical protein
MDANRLNRCFARLIRVSRVKGGKITYGQAAGELGVANQTVAVYLNAIYAREIERRGVPDLTLVCVNSTTGYGRYLSRGAPSRSVPMRPDNAADRRLYDNELGRVHEHWSRRRPIVNADFLANPSSESKRTTKKLRAPVKPRGITIPNKRAAHKWAAECHSDAARL